MKMKKFIKAVVLAVCLTMAMPVVTPSVGITTVEAATKVKLNCTKKTIYEGDSFKLKVTGTTKKVKWSSLDKNVATVSSKGVVKGIGEGTAKITATVGGKKYTCKVTVKVKYGTVSGNVTYHYNQYRGYVADPKSPVILIPTDKNIKNVDSSVLDDFNNLSVFTFSNAVNTLKNIGIYATTTDGSGNFTISHVPEGNYLVYIVSKETSTGGWFDAYDDSISDASDSYYREISSPMKKYIDTDLAFYLGKMAGSRAYAYEYVSVYENETSTVTYEFPYTYI